MLILTRRTGEKIVIGNKVIVTILAIKGGQVKIGIEAPIGIAVNREEIHKKILSQLNQSKYK
jgi:carbon storage regulator